MPKINGEKLFNAEMRAYQREQAVKKRREADERLIAYHAWLTKDIAIGSDFISGKATPKYVTLDDIRRVQRSRQVELGRIERSKDWKRIQALRKERELSRENSD